MCIRDSCHTMILHNHCPHFLDNGNISDCYGLPECWSLSTEKQPSLKWLYQYLICVNPHCIIAESLLNPLDGFCVGIPQFTIKLDAVLLLQVFICYKKIENGTNTCCSIWPFGSYWNNWWHYEEKKSCIT